MIGLFLRPVSTEETRFVNSEITRQAEALWVGGGELRFGMRTGRLHNISL